MSTTSTSFGGKMKGGANAEHLNKHDMTTKFYKLSLYTFSTFDVPAKKITENRDVGKTQLFVNTCTSWREVKTPYESTIVELPRNIFCIP